MQQIKLKGIKLGCVEETLWKKILKLRVLAKPFLRCLLGSGRNTLFSHDDWTLFSPLIDDQ